MASISAAAKKASSAEKTARRAAGYRSSAEAKAAGYSPSGSSSGSGTPTEDVIKDDVTGNSYSRSGPNGTYALITPTSLSPVTPVTLPREKTVDDVGGLVGGNNAGLAAGLAGSGYSLDAKGLFSYTAPETGGMEDIFKQYLGAQEPPSDLASIQAKLEKDNKIRQKEEAVKTYTNQINQITTKAQAEALALEGQGRGVTESIIGGQQAQINREAAIAALPIQANLAAASGDLETARAHVDKLFSIYSQDATNKYNYKTKLVDAVYNFATTQEKARLDELSKKEDQAFQAKQAELAFQRQQSLNKLQFVSGTANQPAGTFNSSTGEFTPLAGSGPTPSKTLGLSQSEQGIQDVSSILKDKNLGSAVGTLPLLGRTSFGLDYLTGGRSNFVAGVEQLRSQLSLDSLVNAKANGATFGALSEGELKLLQQSGSKLSSWALTDKNGKVTGYKTSEKEFKNEVQKIQNFKTLDYILKGGDPMSAGAVLQPDGTVWVENWDGSYTQVY